MKRIITSYIISLTGLMILSCEKPEEDNAVNQSFVLRKDTGIEFSNDIDESYNTFFEFFSYVYNGGGVAAGDINNDGLVDLYFTGNQVKDKLYLNKGNLQFEDISKSSGIENHDGWCNGVTMSDVNQDGYIDIYISRGGWQQGPDERRNLLYINNQDGTFTESAAAYGIDDTGYSNQATFVDIDNDNDLDMYLINRPPSFNLALSIMEERAANPPDFSRDKLYINDGSNFYTEAALERGIKNFGYSLGVVSGDVNNDGYQDIFVCNDYATPDHLYINQGNGYFVDAIQDAMNHSSLYSMGVDLADFNNDLMEDYIVMEMRPTDYVRSKVSMPSMDVEGFKAIVAANMGKQYMHNMLHMNQGNGKFSDVSQLAGLAKTDWSWSPLWYDINNDGKKDLFITNGMRRDSFDGDSQDRLKQFIEKNRDNYQTPQDLFGNGFKDIIEVFNPILIPNYYYMNKGNFEFEMVDDSALNRASFSNGAIVADLDNDGDLDIVTNNIEEAAFVLENVGETGNWLKIKLQGPKGNLLGEGAKVYAYSGIGAQFFQQKLTRGYLSSQDPLIQFGFDTLNTIDSIVVVWPDKRKNVMKEIKVNSIVTVDYNQSFDWQPAPAAPTLFHEVTRTVLTSDYLHQDNDYNEFTEQVLLPHQFSTSGPTMAIADINGDQIDDFYVGGSRGHSGTLFLSDGTHNWKISTPTAFKSDAEYEDAASVFFDYDQDGDLDLFVASGGSDRETGNSLYQNRLYKNENGIFQKAPFPKAASNSSAVIAYDFDRDGDEDLFVGGYTQTNRYPNADPSHFFRNDGGTFTDATAAWSGINLGIVFDAHMADLDNDNIKELVVAGEWMPVKVLSFQNGAFRDVTDAYGLSETTGWWNSIASADIDGDGDLDLIAGNLGENYKFKVSEDNIFRIYADDFDGNGTYDVFLANKKSDKLLPVRGKECSSQQVPSINTNFPSFNSFANAELDDILGAGIENSLQYEIDIFSTVIFMNENGSFIPVKPPKEAQISTVNSIVITDFNGDGKVDLLLAGNRFNTEVETTPSDASLGQLLINKGNFKFEAIPATKSGLYLSGDIKDIRLIDGKYLISTENQGPLRVHQLNVELNPGLYSMN